MFSIVVIFVLSTSVFAGPLLHGRHGRIVNGVETTIEKHPYQVSLLTYSGGHFCGGALISEDIIVTAAHCMLAYSAKQVRVRLGSNEYEKGGEWVAVKSLKYHEGFNPLSMMNDIAVIKMSSPVRQSAKIRYIPMATKTPATGTSAMVTGWGVQCFLTCTTKSKILKEVDVNIINEKDCASSEYKYGSTVKPTMVCAAAPGKSSCQGDSGGPLVAEGKLVGIVSWSVGCGSDGFPGVYADVPSLRAWIEKTAKEL
ncbi:trypsin-like [Stomoxys calcitrans]|uniref:trypsin-like n=1 Tax=Stomoxys calcitrans TaxID=35570 RepID=UPI0027E24666|nr:trypsin-like [Stomoxys calcitrans]